MARVSEADRDVVDGAVVRRRDEYHRDWDGRACIINTHRVYHRILVELEQGFPKPAAKVSEVFGRGLYAP
eukprot:SAG11_NODE_1213_length_5506_cov_2.953579_6_plen_70_part_00